MKTALDSVDTGTHRTTLRAETPPPSDTMDTTLDSVDVDTYHATLKPPPKMKSVRYHGAGDIRVEDIEEPLCGKGQVKASTAPHLQPNETRSNQASPDATSLRRNLRHRYFTTVSVHG